MMDGGYQIYTRNLMRLWGIDGRKLQLPEVMDQEVSCDLKSSTLVAAAGCASDCDALKRQLTFQLRAHGDTTTIPTRSVAQLVSQTLYSRRTFPYYSFCVVGGLLNEHDDEAGGTVYVYDAIGSMEQVAVATAGTGRELLQPIMDRLFSSSVEERNQVDCSSDEAMTRVIEAYHAVAEREIGVGDSVVLCLLEPSSSEGEDPAVVKCRIIRVPLKKH
jgi:20S proteasome subunit beta 6